MVEIPQIQQFLAKGKPSEQPRKPAFGQVPFLSPLARGFTAGITLGFGAPEEPLAPSGEIPTSAKIGRTTGQILGTVASFLPFVKGAQLGVGALGLSRVLGPQLGKAALPVISKFPAVQNLTRGLVTASKAGRPISAATQAARLGKVAAKGTERGLGTILGFGIHGQAAKQDPEVDRFERLKHDILTGALFEGAGVFGRGAGSLFKSVPAKVGVESAFPAALFYGLTKQQGGDDVEAVTAAAVGALLHGSLRGIELRGEVRAKRAVERGREAVKEAEAADIAPTAKGRARELQKQFESTVLEERKLIEVARKQGAEADPAIRDQLNQIRSRMNQQLETMLKLEQGNKLEPKDLAPFFGADVRPGPERIAVIKERLGKSAEFIKDTNTYAEARAEWLKRNDIVPKLTQEVKPEARRAVQQPTGIETEQVAKGREAVQRFLKGERAAPEEAAPVPEVKPEIREEAPALGTPEALVEAERAQVERAPDIDQRFFELDQTHSEKLLPFAEAEGMTFEQARARLRADDAEFRRLDDELIKVQEEIDMPEEFNRLDQITDTEPPRTEAELKAAEAHVEANRPKVKDAIDAMEGTPLGKENDKVITDNVDVFEQKSFKPDIRETKSEKTFDANVEANAAGDGTTMFQRLIDKSGFLGSIVETGTSWLDGHGPTGRAIGDMFTETLRVQDGTRGKIVIQPTHKSAQKLISKLNGFFGRTAAQLDEVTKVGEGYAQGTPEMKANAKVFQDSYADLATIAEEAGFKFARREGYMGPAMLNNSGKAKLNTLSTPEKLSQASGGKISVGQATRILDNQFRKQPKPNEFKSLTESRDDIDLLLESGVISEADIIWNQATRYNRYVSGLINAIAEKQAFGPEGEGLNKAMDAFRATHTKEINDGMERVVEAGRGLTVDALGLERLSSDVRMINILTLLGKAAIFNVFQAPVNLSALFGTKAALKGLAKSFSQEGIKTAKMFGVIDESMSTIRRAGGVEPGEAINATLGKMVDYFMTFNAMKPTEIMNRTWSANTTKAAMQDLLNTAIRTGKTRNLAGLIKELELERLIDVERAMKNGTFTADEWQRIVSNGVRFTQFMSTPLDMPVFYSHPLGKMFLQFKTFTTGQSRLIPKVVRRIVRDKNYSLLLPILTFVPLSGIMATNLKKMLRGEDLSEDETSFLVKYMEGLFALGFGGAYYDMMERTYYAGASGALEWMTGPTLSGASDLMAATQELATEQDITQLGRLVTSRLPIPFVGQTISEKVFPRDRKDLPSFLEDVLGGE